MIIPIKHIEYCATQALFDIMESAPALELAWMNQKGVWWMGNVAPHDNYGQIKVKEYTVGPTQRTIALPRDMIRTSRILMSFGGEVYDLTVDPNIALPPSLQFECDPSGGTIESHWSWGEYGSLRPTLPGNSNYYRVNDGLITFNSVPPEGRLVIEYLASVNATPYTIVHNGYCESLRLYLTWQYWEKKAAMADPKSDGAAQRFALTQASRFQGEYENQIFIANTTVKCPKLADIMDIIAPY